MFQGLIGLVQARERALAAEGISSEPLHVIVSWNLGKYIEATNKQLLPISDKLKWVWHIFPIWSH